MSQFTRRVTLGLWHFIDDIIRDCNDGIPYCSYSVIRRRRGFPPKNLDLSSKEDTDFGIDLQGRRRGRVVRAARLWRRKSPYRVSSRLGFAMWRPENSVDQQ